MASDGQVLIDLLFPANKQEFHTDIDWANDLLKRFGAGAGDTMDEDFKSNTHKMKDESEDTKNKVNKNLSGIKKEVRTKLAASADKAGIKNFGSLLGQLPKKQITELAAKAEKGQAIDWKEEIDKMPRSVVTQFQVNSSQATRGLDQLNTSVEGTTGNFSHLKEIVTGSFLGSALASGVGAVAGEFKSLGAEAIESSDSVQKFQSTMKLGGFGKAEIKSTTKEVQDYANKTVYDLSTVANTTAQLAANGVKGYMNLTEAAGNLNAQAGGNAETFKSVAMVLTQTAGAGKLTTENWNQLADAIPGASGVLQKAMKDNGAYTGNFRDAMEKGQISSDEFNKAITQLGMNDGAKKAAASTSTFEGAFGNLEANIVTGMDNIIQSVGKKKLTDIINDASDVAVKGLGYVVKFVEYVDNHKNTVKDFAVVLGTVFVAGKIMKATTALGGFITAVKTMSGLSVVNPLAGLTSTGVSVAEAATSRVAANSIGATSMLGTRSLFKGAASTLALGKTVPVLAAGTGVATELMSKNSTGEKIGGSAGSVAGTAAGAAIGSMILPGIGTAIGGVAGSAIGKKLGEVIGKGAEEHFKGNPIKASVKVKTTAADIDDGKISKSLQPSLKKLDKQLMLKFNADPSSIGKTKTETEKLYSSMSKSIDSYYKNKESKSKKDLDALVKQGVMTQKQADAALAKQKTADEKARQSKQNALKDMKSLTNGYYSQVQNIENGGTKHLQQIAQKYGTNSKKYEDAKNKALEKAHKKFVNSYVADEYSLNTKVAKDVSKGTAQQKSIYEKLIKDKGKLNANELKATQKHAKDLYNSAVKEADKTRDDVVKAATSKHDKTVKIADHEYNDLHSISKAQHKKIVAEADGQLTDTTNAADKQYKEVTKSAHDQHKKVTSEINKQKDDVTNAANTQARNHAIASDTEMADVGGNYAAGFKAAGKIWHGFTKWIGKIFSVFDDKKTFPAEVTNFGAFAKGSSGLPNDQVALVGEEGFELGKDAQGFHVLGAQGPEIRSLRAGTSILTHDQSIRFLRKIGLPGYAKGTEDDDSSFLSTVFDMVTKGAGKLWSWIKDKTGIDGLINALTSKGLVKDATSDSFNSAKNAIVKSLTKLGDSFGGGAGGSVPSGDHAKVMLAAGVPAGWLDAMNWIINVESGWKTDATNKSSGAYGLPQSLPASKLASAGPDWRTNPVTQIKWMLNYIKGRYGTAAKAVAFHKAKGWYAEGGEPEEDGLYRLAEGNNKEFVVPNPTVAGVDRTYAMIGKSAAYVAAKQGLQANSGSSDSAALKSALIGAFKNLGNVNIQTVVDGKTLATASYPTLKFLQANELTISGTGTAIRVGGVN